MLVLSRKVGQSVIIGQDIVIRVLEIRGHLARIGVEAPISIPVVREELQRAAAEANAKAVAHGSEQVAAVAAILRRRDDQQSPRDPSPAGRTRR